MHKAGFVNIVGNPNVGKSTLMNQLVGERISIATFKAQTTRHRIMGIVNTPDMQIVLSDTPGVLKPNYKMQEMMLAFSESALADADVLLYVTDVVENPEKNMDFLDKVRKMTIPVLLLSEWYKEHPDWNITIIRPTVLFGERNRGNVYNLIYQIAHGRFLMVGNGNNVKSMAYVGNVVAFVKYLIDNVTVGYNVYNYVDKPDFTMNELVGHVEKVMNIKIPSRHFPYKLGIMGGYAFDALAFVTQKKLAISSVRVKKFCATTKFNYNKMLSTGFLPPFSLKEGLRRTLEFEFLHPIDDGIIFPAAALPPLQSLLDGPSTVFCVAVVE